MSLEGYYSAEGTFCFEEWMRFETEDCSYEKWDEECAAVFDSITNPLQYDDDELALMLATLGKAERRNSNFGAEMATGVVVGAVLGLTALLALSKYNSSKNYLSDEFIRA